MRGEPTSGEWRAAARRARRGAAGGAAAREAPPPVWGADGGGRGAGGPLAGAGSRQEELEILLGIAPITALVDAQAGQHALVRPAADGVGVHAEPPRGVADAQEVAGGGRGRGWRPPLGIGWTP